MNQRTRLLGLGLILVAVAGTAAGCWDKTEVDDKAFVMAIGLDEAPDNELYVTFLIAVPRAVAGGGGLGGGDAGGGDPQAGLITTLRGRSVLSLMDMVNTNVDRGATLVHGKVVVVGESLARRGLAPYIGELTRFQEVRRTMFLAIAKGTARDFIMKNRPVIERNPAKNLELLALTNRKAGLVPPSQIHRFLAEMQSLGEEPLVILAGVRKEGPTAGGEQTGGKTSSGQAGQAGDSGAKEGGPDSSELLPKGRPSRSDTDYTAGNAPWTGGNPIEFLGAAVFKGDRMVGEITGFETRAVLLLRGTFKRAFAVSRDPLMENRFVSYDLRIARPTQVRVSRREQGFHIDVEVMLEGGVIGSQSTQDYSNPKNLSVLEASLARELKKLFEDTISKAQTEFGSDIFAFGNKARHLVLTWQEWQDLNWPEKFPKASFSVQVELALRRTGLLFKPPEPSAARGLQEHGR